jgi:hypothetical protein
MSSRDLFAIARRSTFQGYSLHVHRQAGAVKDKRGHNVYDLTDLKTCLFCEAKSTCQKTYDFDPGFLGVMLSMRNSFFANVKAVYYCEAWHLAGQYELLFSKTKNPVKKNFYNSLDWKRLRAKVLEEQQGKCQLCGRTHREHGITLHVDHIVPISKDWNRRLDITNLQILCEDCNMGKGNRYQTDWRQGVTK